MRNSIGVFAALVATTAFTVGMVANPRVHRCPSPSAKSVEALFAPCQAPIAESQMIPISPEPTEAIPSLPEKKPAFPNLVVSWLRQHR